MIATKGTVDSIGPNNIGTTAGTAKELGMVSMTENNGTNVAFPAGTTGVSFGMENAVNTSNDTTMMAVPEGTVTGDPWKIGVGS